jgi:trehalose 6-phosphate phosphatase
VELEARIATLPLAETFVISRESQDEAEVVQVEVRHGDVSGFGEAAPIARYEESAQSAFEWLNRVELGDDPWALDEIHERLPAGEQAARAAIDAIATKAESTGLRTHWGRKVLEVRPPVRIDKGAGISSFLADTDVDVALYVGDDATDLDAFHALVQLTDEGRISRAIRVGVRSDEGPSEITDEADLVVDGPGGVTQLLAALAAD